MSEKWAERLREAELCKNVYRVFRETPIPTCRDIVEKAGREYRKAAGGTRNWREVEARRLQAVYHTVRRALKRILELPKPEEMSTFHRELVDAAVGLDAYRKALDRVRRSLHLAKRFYSDYIVLVTTSRSRREAARYRREGCGRILSLIHRLCRHLEILENVRREVLNAHIVAEGLPVVVVAGAPNTGKSTLISRLSTAAPEVAPYPFTTKNVIVGKVKPLSRNCIDYYMVDVPGLLDRQPRSEAEKRAVAAIKTLTDVLVFMLDPTGTAVEPLDRQLELLRRINELIHPAPLIIAINKIDAATRAEVIDALRRAEELCRETPSCRRVVAVSALRGDNLEELQREVEKLIAEMLTAAGRAP